MKTIDAQTLKARIDAGEKINLLDVREDYEHAEYNIGGTLLSLGKIQSMQVDDIMDWKDEEIIVYCRSGNRSGIACLFMEQVGFSNMVNLTGGMLGWQEKFK